MKKKTGRAVARPPAVTRALILQTINAAPYGMTCKDVGIAVQVTISATRTHLNELIKDGLCACLRVAKEGKRPKLHYCVTTRPIEPPPGFSVRAPTKQAPEIVDDDSWLEIVREHKPAGQWRADHIPAVRSVFDLGVCA